MLGKKVVDFDTIRSLVKLSDPYLFQLYLSDIYKDLLERCSDVGPKGLTQIVFTKFFDLPVFIAEALFLSFDKDKDKLLSIKEFSEGIRKLYIGSFSETCKAVFDIYDFDKDEKINSQDIRLIFKHIPLLPNSTEESDLNFEIGFDIELDELLERCFAENTSIDINDFEELIAKEASDPFSVLISYLYENNPFNPKNTHLYINDSPIMAFTARKSLKLPFPILDKKLVTSNFFLESGETVDTDGSGIDDDISEESEESFKINLPLTKKPHFFRRNSVESNRHLQIMMTCDNVPTEYLGLQFFKNISSQPLKSNLLDNEKNSDISYEDTVFKLTKKERMKNYWLQLSGKEIYYFKSNIKSRIEGMHHLSGCFVKENGHKVISGIKYFCFSIIFENKVRNYFTQSQSSAEKWVANLRKAIKLRNIFEFYEIFDDIGDGKFGSVKLGRSQETGEKVAIKIIEKSKMNALDQELVRTEIDIMRRLKHPNVIKLLDCFENHQFIFIVMEYFEDGDLSQFVIEKFIVNESQIAKMLYQITLGLKYIHDFGVIHRDLKPQNILFVNKGKGEFTVKITDFGLSKIIRSHQKTQEGFGSLSYVAPEVLIKRPYDQKVDIWSLGIIAHLLLSGKLPFDDDKECDKIIAKLIVYTDVEFSDPVWLKRSNESKNFVKSALIKNPDRRVSLQELLDSEWFRKFGVGKGF